MKTNRPAPVLFRSALLVALFGFAAAYAEKPYGTPEIQGALQELQTAVDQQKETNANQWRENRRFLQNMWVLLDQENVENLRYLFSEGAQLTGSEQIEAAFRKVRSAVSARTAELEKEEQAEAGALLKEAAEAVAKATEISDLDGIIAKLNSARSSTQRRSNASDRDRRLQSASSFVCRWQEIIAMEKSGRFADAHSALRGLVESSRDDAASLMPRSQIIARAEAAGEKAGDNRAKPRTTPDRAEPPDSTELIRQTVAKAKTVEDISRVVDELRGLRTSGTVANNDRAGHLLEQAASLLTEISKQYLLFKEGLQSGYFERPDPLQGRAPDAAFSDVMVGLQQDVLRRTLPVLLGEQKDLPGANETPGDYLKRYYATAMSAQQWDRALRAAEIANKLQPKSIENEAALRLLNAATRLESAGFWTGAASEYEKATRAAREPFPLQLIAERMEKLRKDHPEEYAAGVERAMQPPQSPYAMPLSNPAALRAMQPLPAPPGAVPSITPATRPPASPSPSPAKK